MKVGFLVLVGVTAVVGAFYLGRMVRLQGSSSGSPDEEPPASVRAQDLQSPISPGELFPDILLEDRAGNRRSLMVLLEGRPAYVLVLSTTCQPCADEIRRWAEATVVPKDLRVIGVVTESGFETDEGWTRADLAFELYRDVDDRLLQAGLSAVPSGFGLDADGRTVVTHYVIQRPLEERLSELRARLRLGSESPDASRFEPEKARMGLD